MKQLLFALTFLTSITIISCSDSGTGPDPNNGNGDDQEVPSYNVNVTVTPSGAGSISPSADGNYEEGEEIELQAKANEGYLFSGWSGDVESSDNPLSLTVEQDYSLTANFKIKNYELTISTEGEGTVSEEVLEQKSKEYEHGTVVELTATPAEGYKFVEWKGDLTSTENPAQITIDEPKEVTAVFEKKNYELTINTSGEGTVKEKIVEAKTKGYEHGTVVELTANPSTGWKFVEWQGDITSTENPAQITIDKPKEVTAVFQKKNPKLSYKPSSFKFSAASGTDTLNITNTGGKSLTWQVSTSAGWLSLNPTSGKDSTKIIISYVKNIDAKRSTIISITSNGGDAKLSVMQDNPDFYLSANGVTVICTEANVGDTGTVNGVTYTKRTASQITTSNAATTCTSDITDMGSLFQGEISFNKDLSSWDVSSVTNMNLMFYNASSFNKKISSWNVSSVISMSRMFFRAKSFNQPINSWDVSNVTDMECMFCGSESFNQPIGSWNVSNVKTMSRMFETAEAFNQPFGNWNVSSVTDMSYMFAQAKSFNQDIGNWDVSNVTNMKWMFYHADSFNQAIGNWNVSNVVDMSAMFNNAASFDQYIGDWDVSNVVDMDLMFYYADSFNQDISSWCVSKIDTEPDNFSTGSALTNAHKPAWGTCPTN